jgi:opacity protein-like surface antigen
MRKLLLAAVLAAFPIIVFPSNASAQMGYVEGSVGFLVTNSVETDEFSALTSGGLFDGTIDFDYDAQWAAGLEGGFMTGPWRFGIAWDYISSEVESAHVVGFIDGVPADFYATDQELEDEFGISGNRDIHIFTVNGYYHFNAFDFASPVQPYLGLGVGAATFQNANTTFAFTATAGANFALGPNVYLGGRYRLGVLSGPTNDFDVSFGELTTHTFSLVLGYRFPV